MTSTTVTDTLAVNAAPASATTHVEPAHAPAAPAAKATVALAPSAPQAVAPLPPAAPAAPSAPVSAAAAATGTPALSISTKSDTWLEVSQPGGVVLAKRMLKAGESVEFAGSAPYAVLLGRADSAEVKVHGRPFDLTPFVRNSVARFEVK